MLQKSTLPVREGEELLAWPDPDAQTLSEAPGQSYETPLAWLGAVPASHGRVTCVLAARVLQGFFF